jgi:hypothetical protein
LVVVARIDASPNVRFRSRTLTYYLNCKLSYCGGDIRGGRGEKKGVRMVPCVSWYGIGIYCTSRSARKSSKDVKVTMRNGAL